jgi:uncharacterized protein with HEPN domain
MNRSEKKLLHDISTSIGTILDDFLEGVHSFEQFEEDKKTQAAVERMLIIIGEAIYKLKRIGIALPFGDQIVNRRNTLAHQYDDYNIETIWLSIHRELPDLKKAVNELLEG